MSYEYGEKIIYIVNHYDISYIVLTNMQKRLIDFIDYFAISDGNDKIITYLTNILNILTDMFFDKI